MMRYVKQWANVFMDYKQDVHDETGDAGLMTSRANCFILIL